MTAPRIGLAVQGRLEEHMRAERHGVSRATQRAPARAAVEHKALARAEVRRGLGGSRRAGRRGRNVANAIRHKVFVDGPLQAAAIVYSKFGRREGGQFVDYFLPFARGGTIRAKGKYMVIPNGGTSRRIKKVFRDLKRLDDDPKLALIPQPGGRFLFVRHTSRRRTTILAWLIRRFRRRKVLDFEGVADQVEGRFPTILLEELESV